MVLKADIEQHLPLSESTYLILLSLAPGPRHGYGIMKDVAAFSQGRVQLSTGTLYGALKRLLVGDWIERAEGDPPPGSGAEGGGRRRRYYVLTERGRGLLEAEVARLRSLVAAAGPRAVEAQP
jgi:DNA-binding PadR family transcriptional regulator